MAGWLGGWLRKAENKAKAQHSWGLGFAELGKNAFVSLINLSVNKKALEYLQKMRGKKGQEIEYREIKMADYLMPYGESLTISEKRETE